MEIARRERALTPDIHGEERGPADLSEWVIGYPWEKLTHRFWNLQPSIPFQLPRVVGFFFQFPSLPTKTLSLSYQAYLENAHFDVGEQMGERVFEDLKRRYATYNGTNLIERAWKNLEGNAETSYFAASVRLQGSTEWPEKEAALRKEFLSHVFPSFVEENCNGMDELEKRAFLGSFHQGSGTIFSTVRHVDRGGLFPFKTTEHEGRVVQNDHETAFVYEAMLAEQCFVNRGKELRYGPSAERLVARVDFIRKQVSLAITPQFNPLCGEEILPTT